jgi:hypothetical protein
MNVTFITFEQFLSSILLPSTCMLWVNKIIGDHQYRLHWLCHKAEMGKIYSTYGEVEKCIQSFSSKTTREYRLHCRLRIIWKFNIEMDPTKIRFKNRLDSTGSEYGLAACFCKDGKESLGSMKEWNSLNQFIQRLCSMEWVTQFFSVSGWSTNQPLFLLFFTSLC